MKSCLNQAGDTQLSIYRRVLREAGQRRIGFAIGGSLALSAHSRVPRPTRDLDLYVKPDDADSMIAVVRDLGLADYYDQVPYDRGWIYRSTTDDTIVDIIWQMANRRTQVDDLWLKRGPETDLAGEPARLVPLEELIWSKLYVLQRDRSDWPDILNLIDATGDRIDWPHLVSRVGDDMPLLISLLQVYAWLRPDAANRLPDWLRARACLENIHDDGIDLTRRRAALLDSRDWLNSVAQENQRRCLSER